MAEVCNEYLSKGRQVLVEGRLRAEAETGGPRVYQRNDGSYGASYEVTAQTVKFLGRAGEAPAAGAPGVPEEPPIEEEEEIPF
jgi:single-strand DNA-binding protein